MRVRMEVGRSILNEPLPHTDNGGPFESDAGIEINRLEIIIADLEIDLRTTERSKTALDLIHKSPPVALSLMRWINS